MFRQMLDVHMAAMAIANEIINRISVVFVRKIIDASDVVNIQFAPQLFFANPAQLTSKIVPLARQSSLPFPRFPIIPIISAAPQRTKLSASNFGKMGGCTRGRTAYSFVAQLDIKGNATINTVSCFPIIGPSVLEIAFRRTAFCFWATMRSVKGFTAHYAVFVLSRSSVWVWIVIAFIPGYTRYCADACARTVFLFLMFRAKFFTALEARECVHSKILNCPYLHEDGKAVRLAVQAVHDTALSHLIFYHIFNRLSQSDPMQNRIVAPGFVQRSIFGEAK